MQSHGSCVDRGALHTHSAAILNDHIFPQIKEQHLAFLEERDMLQAMMDMDRECAATSQGLLEEKIKDLEKHKTASQAEILGLRLYLCFYLCNVCVTLTRNVITGCNYLMLHDS